MPFQNKIRSMLSGRTVGFKAQLVAVAIGGTLILALFSWLDFETPAETVGNPKPYERMTALNSPAPAPAPSTDYSDDFADLPGLDAEEGVEEDFEGIVSSKEKKSLKQDDDIDDADALESIVARTKKVKAPAPKSLLQQLLADAAQYAQLTDAPIDYLIRIAALQDRARDRSGARASLDWAAENAFEIAEVTELSESLSRVTAAQARYGSLTRAEALSEFIPFAEDKWKALSELSKNQARRRAIESAKATALEISDEKRRSETLIWVAMQQAVLKDFEGAMTTARAITGPLSSEALERVAIGMARAQETTEARRAVQLIPRPDEKAEALAEVAGMSARVGNVSDASQLGWMIPSSYTTEKSRAWSRISDAHVRNRNYSEAVVAASLIDLPMVREATLQNIAVERSRAGDFAGAQSTIDHILDERSRNQSLKRLAQAQAVFLDGYGARKTIGQIRDPLEKELALGTVAKTQVRVGDFAGAERTAELIILADQRSSALADIARYQARSGELNGANTNLIEAYALSFTIPPSRRRSEILVEIASAQAEARQVDHAFEIARTIEDPRMQVRAIDAVAKSQAISGDVAGAVITAMNIESPSSRESTLLGIASYAGSEIDVSHAQSIMDQFDYPEQKVRFILTLAQRLLPKKSLSPVGFAPDNSKEFWRKLITQTG
ncbi:MAG: hypothetical protein AAGJ79_02275 [Verrucomicrobiota bacterium]